MGYFCTQKTGALQKCYITHDTTMVSGANSIRAIVDGASQKVPFTIGAITDASKKTNKSDVRILVDGKKQWYLVHQDIILVLLLNCLSLKVQLMITQVKHGQQQDHLH